MSMTVGHLLNTDILRSVTLVAGHAGLDRIVESVNMMDAPDITEWIRPHQLLISTLYNMRDDVDGLKQLVPLLVERGCSALGIKAQRYFSKIPDVMVEMANRHHLPLFEIPTEVPLGVLAHEVTKTLLRGESPVSYGTQVATQRVVQAVLTEPQVDEVANQLSRATRGAVVILTNSQEVWGRANYSLATERFNYLLKQLPQLSLNHASEPEALIVEDLRIERIPAVLNGTVYGTILLIDPKLQSPKLVESSVHALSLAKLRQHLADERWQLWMHQMVQRLVTDGAGDDLYATSRELGLDGRLGFGVVIGRIDGQSAAQQLLGNHWFPRQSVWGAVLDWTISSLKDRGWSPIGALDDDRMVLLLSANPTLESVRNLSEEAITHLRQISGQLATDHGIRLHFSLGSLYSSATYLPFSYREAQEVDAQGRSDNDTVHVYQSHKAKDVVKVVPPAERARFVEVVLGPLLTMPWTEREVLLRTLESYFACEGQATEAARALFVHRNTVLYRLRKLEEILNRSFSDPDDVLTIRLSLLFLANLQ